MKNNEILELHLKYWIFILVIGCILIATWRLGSEQAVVGQIGLAATLASLILAIVAIIYTFVSTQSMGGTIGKLESASVNISAVSGDISNAASALSKEIDKLPSLVSARINELHPIIQEVSEKVDITQSMIREREISLSSEDVYSLNNENIDVNRFYSICSLSGRLILYACAHSVQNKAKLDLEKLKQAVNSIDIQYTHGFLVCAASIGILDYEQSDDNYHEFTITKMKNEFQIEAISGILTAIESHDTEQDHKARLVGNLGSILNMFS